MQMDERYAVATGSSNLRCEGDRPGDLDTVIAAGMSGQSVGATLSRCRAEFDDVHGMIPDTTAPALRRAQATSRMVSLKPALAAMIANARERRDRCGFGFTDEMISRLAWNAISVWLDPTCGGCHGVGMTGGYSGKPSMRCATCRGTKKRRESIGRTPQQQEFIESSIAWVEVQVSEFQNRTRARLRNETPA